MTNYPAGLSVCCSSYYGLCSCSLSICHQLPWQNRALNWCIALTCITLEGENVSSEVFSFLSKSCCDVKVFFFKHRALVTIKHLTKVTLYTSDCPCPKCKQEQNVIFIHISCTHIVRHINAMVLNISLFWLGKLQRLQVFYNVLFLCGAYLHLYSGLIFHLWYSQSSGHLLWKFNKMSLFKFLLLGFIHLSD